ncbi:AMP-dependent synthetase [Trinickia violacea]|uniref:AMP-dependent synthetase n=1 Tax=Trinickia violacea TaxID=2571746 RepID=A0A4P8INL3_9BURK|nr:AMP-binding protein [Trinickia violacea]QCP50608.1 AMP-dependent synthetase [Trinickia violacea]
MIALHDLLAVPRDGRTPVCADGGAVLDFAAFDARVRACVATLRERPAQRVALCIDDPFDFACALFALFACDKEPVIPASSNPGYLAALADAYDTIVTDADLSALPAAGGNAADSARDALPIDPLAPLTLYTSGSSGAPKPIRKTLAQFNAEVHTLEKQWGALVGAATMLASVPHHHIYGLLFRVMWPLAAGRAFDRATCAEPHQLAARLALCGAGAVVSSPAQLARWPDLAGFDALAPAPCVFFSSGGPLAAEAALAYSRQYGGAPIEIYGSTETGGIAWRQQDDSDAWQPVHGIDIRREGDGALAVRSPHLGHDDWHRTDDAILVGEDGRFRLQGRLDRVVKLDGKRVSLPEIEAQLARHPFVAQAALTPLRGASRDRLGALVVLNEAGSEAFCAQGRVALAKILRRHLAAYADAVVLPRRWRFHAAMPFDARGKLPAAAVAAVFEAREEGVEVLAQVRHGGALHYDLRVPPTLVHFAGHFPGLAILPGVVQIDWAMKLAAEQVEGVREIASIDRLKFMAPVPPGAVLQLTLAPDAARGRVRFAYRLGERECASGIFVCGGRP